MFYYFYMKLYERIKELRLENKLTQKELAKAIDVDATIISKWELGHKRPVYEDLIKLAGLFNVSTDYLLGLADI